jgi:CBS domain-containing protein
MQTLRDIMTPDPVTLDAEMTLRQAIEVLRAAAVSGAPVVRGDRVVGVVSGSDILEFEASSPGVPPERSETLEFGELDAPPEEVEDVPGAYFVDRWFDTESDVWTRVSETDSPEWDRMEEHQVSEVMSHRLISFPSDASVADAARCMVDERLHRVLVVDGERLVGVVSTFDIVAGMAAMA